MSVAFFLLFLCLSVTARQVPEVLSLRSTTKACGTLTGDDFWLFNSENRFLDGPDTDAHQDQDHMLESEDSISTCFLQNLASPVKPDEFNTSEQQQKRSGGLLVRSVKRVDMKLSGEHEREIGVPFGTISSCKPGSKRSGSFSSVPPQPEVPIVVLDPLRQETCFLSSNRSLSQRSVYKKTVDKAMRIFNQLDQQDQKLFKSYWETGDEKQLETLNDSIASKKYEWVMLCSIGKFLEQLFNSKTRRNKRAIIQDPLSERAGDGILQEESGSVDDE